jgi:hypothetical protein
MRESTVIKDLDCVVAMMASTDRRRCPSRTKSLRPSKSCFQIKRRLKQARKQAGQATVGSLTYIRVS